MLVTKRMPLLIRDLQRGVSQRKAAAVSFQSMRMVPRMMASTVFAKSSLTGSSEQNTEGKGRQSNQRSNNGDAKSLIATFVVGIGGTYVAFKSFQHEHPATVSAAEETTFSSDEVAKHNSLDNGIWVTYGDNVYDITEFVEGHPGGSKIMLAAGGPIEPFWDIYAIHKSSTILEILESMKIGQLDSHGKKKISKRQKVKSAWSDEPEDRHPAFLINTMTPFDAEPPAGLLTDNFITPNKLFFVRNHLPVPKIDPESYRLEINIQGKAPIKLTLNDLKTKYKKYEVTATLMCAGNRRFEMGKHKPIYGVTSGHSAISNATWGGARLCDILRDAGMSEDTDNDIINHIQFEGLDEGAGGSHYGASIPVEKAMSRQGDVLLAYEMNGETVPPDHGYPIRAIVPGVVGARNVKWLGKITASEAESDNHWQKNDYKVSPPSVVDRDSYDISQSPPIYESPVQSAICHPAEGTVIDAEAETIEVSGYAWSGGGNGILRVDISIDGGETWQSAALETVDQKMYRKWAWTLWKTSIPVPKGGADSIDILCKAVDSFHNSQPESVSSIWNMRGLLANAWHKVTVNIKEE